MRISGGDTIEVFRSDGADRFGDRAFSSIGTIGHVIVQWASASSSALRFHSTDSMQETSSISAVLFCPRDAAITLQARDRIVLNNRTFQVVGDPEWYGNNPVTGTVYSHYMMQVEMVS
ncbi:MAG: hypothetical protein ACKODT_08045 [Fluviibacter sp.]